MGTGFTIQTEVFEGPLDLLLALIEKRKLLINDISLAAVTDDFIKHLNAEEEGVPLSARAHFVLVASTLLLIKSKSLLPGLSLNEEEAESIEDLERRLRLYKRFRALSQHIQQNFGTRALYTPQKERAEVVVFAPSSDLDRARILTALRDVLRSLPPKEFIPEAVVAKVISIEEMVERLSERITKKLNVSFGEFSGMGKEDKTNVIISFLAMLELVKQGMIAVTQDSLFADITMESDSVSTPRYG